MLALPLEFEAPDPGLCWSYILTQMVQKGSIFIFWLPKHILVWFSECVALLWRYFIPVTAGIRCYSGWVFWCIYGCQCVHFYKTMAPLKAACTTFWMFYLLKGLTWSTNRNWATLSLSVLCTHWRAVFSLQLAQEVELLPPGSSYHQQVNSGANP